MATLLPHTPPHLLILLLLLQILLPPITAPHCPIHMQHIILPIPVRVVQHILLIEVSVPNPDSPALCWLLGTEVLHVRLDDVGGPGKAVDLKAVEGVGCLFTGDGEVPEVADEAAVVLRCRC